MQNTFQFRTSSITRALLVGFTVGIVPGHPARAAADRSADLQRREFAGAADADGSCAGAGAGPARHHPGGSGARDRAYRNTAMVPPAEVAAERAKVGNPMVALLNVWAKVTQGDAGEYIHYGPTTQDIFDTTELMQMRQAAALMIGQMRDLEASMLRIAKEHRATPMMGRTLGRHALPLTFGAKVASWAAENRRNIERLKGWVARSNTTMISGAVGSYASMGDTAFEVEAEVAKELGNAAPFTIDWKGSKDMHAEYGAILAIASKTLGKIGQEVFLLQGDDIRELEDPNPGVGSSTMPHKINPQYSIPMIKASRVIPQQAEVLQAWMMTIFERDQISNADMLEEISKTFDGQLRSANALMRNLKVHPENMARNLNRTQGLVMTEEAMFLPGKEVGKKTAHDEINLAARVSWEKGTPFTQEILARPKCRCRQEDQS